MNRLNRWLSWVLFVVISGCTLDPPITALPDTVESRHGVQPTNEREIPLAEADGIAIRPTLGDLRLPFFITVDDELAEWAVAHRAVLDVEEAAIRVEDETLPIRNVDASVVVPGLSHPEWLISNDGSHVRPFDTEPVRSGIRYGMPWAHLELARLGDSLTIWQPLGTTDVVDGQQARYTQHHEFRADSVQPVGEWEAPLGAIEAQSPVPLLFGNMTGLYVPRTTIDAGQQGALEAAVRDIPRMPWGYIENGCPARADLAARALVDAGATPVKVFIEGRLETFVDGERFGWTFHVAPALLVRDGDRTALRLLDFALDDHFIAVSAWLERFATGPVVMHVMPHWQSNPPVHTGLEVESRWGDRLADSRGDADYYWERLQSGVPDQENP